MPYCSSCGSFINSTYKFCCKCGVSVSSILVKDNSSLIRRLRELANCVDSLASVNSQIETLKLKTSIPEPKKPVVFTRWMAMEGFIFSGCGAFAGAIIVLWMMYYITFDSSEIMGLNVICIVYFLLLAVGVTLIVIGVTTSKKRVKKYNSKNLIKYNAEVQRREAMLLNYQHQYSILEHKKKNILNQIQNCLMNDGNSIVIPSSYFYSDAIRFFADRISTGRANSLSEAIYAYNMRGATTTISDTTSIPKTDTYRKRTEEMPLAFPQDTIYIYTKLKDIRLCLFCDGENSVEAKKCDICGQNLV